MIHAATLLLLMLFLALQASKLPLGALSAILIVVAYNMSEIEHCRAILKGPVSDRMVFIATYALTGFIDLIFCSTSWHAACLLFVFAAYHRKNHNPCLPNPRKRN